MRIWKFPLQVASLQTIEMPAGARILSVQTQFGRPELWALCDETAPLSERRIAVYGTGQPMPNVYGKYVGTFQLDGGHLVFHAFEPQ